MVDRKKCEHGREKTKCRDCKGGSFCPHDLIRSSCSLCSTESVWKLYRYRAEKREIRFDLTLAQFSEITSRPCCYCNQWGQPRGVDRKNNFEPYVFKNSVAACARCNRWKSDDTEDTFLGHALKIAQHTQKKQLKLQSPISQRVVGETKSETSETSSVTQ